MFPEHDNLRVLLSIDLYKRKSFADRAKAKEAWSSFCCKFRDEASCRKDLFIALKESTLLICRSCQSTNNELCADLRRYACLQCGAISWVSSGTFFEGVCNLRAWYAAFWFFGRGAIVSSRWFSFIVGVSQSTALEIYWNVLHVLKNAWSSVGPKVGTAHFVDLFVKRSVCSVRKAHPRMEERQEYLDYLSSLFHSKDSESANDCQNEAAGDWQSNSGSVFDSSVSINSDSLSSELSSASAASSNSSRIAVDPLSKGAADSNSSDFSPDIGVVIDAGIVIDAGSSSLKDRLLDLLRQGPRTVDSLIELLAAEASAVLAELSELELLGFVRSFAGGFVGLCSESHSTKGSHNFNQQDKQDTTARQGRAGGAAATKSLSESEEGETLYEWFQCSNHGCSICSPEGDHGWLVQQLSENIKYNIRRLFSGLSRKYLALYLQLNKLTGALQEAPKFKQNQNSPADRPHKGEPDWCSPQLQDECEFRRVFESCLFNGKPEAECITRFVSPLMVSVPIFS